MAAARALGPVEFVARDHGRTAGAAAPHTGPGCVECRLARGATKHNGFALDEQVAPVVDSWIVALALPASGLVRWRSSPQRRPARFARCTRASSNNLCTEHRV